MAVEMLSYAALAERLSISSEAARALVKRHRLQRSRANDGKTLVAVDLSEIAHRPSARSPGGHRAEQLRAKVELATMELTAAGHRADFERERERAERLMTELLKATAELICAKEAAARLEGALHALRSWPWWRRLVG
jgi:hypothetical protein